MAKAISIHASGRGGRRGRYCLAPCDSWRRIHASARRATSSSNFMFSSLMIFIHALREEGDCSRRSADPWWPILSTPPRGGRPVTSALPRVGSYPLYPRPPREGDSGSIPPAHPRSYFIHALREEGDLENATYNPRDRDFYPRPPRGGRRFPVPQPDSLTHEFYPRPPRGGRHITAGRR